MESYEAMIIIAVGVFVLATFIIAWIIFRKAKESFYKFKAPLKQSGEKAIFLDTAYLVDIAQTASNMNNLPVMQMTVAVFPAKGPMGVATCRQVLDFGDELEIKPGAPLDVTYERNKKGEIIKLRIQGIKRTVWAGDPSVIETARNIFNKMKDAAAKQAQGTILFSEPSGAMLDGVLVYKYHITFMNEVGITVNGNAYQATRPWLIEERTSNPSVTVLYNADNEKNFILANQ